MGEAKDGSPVVSSRSRRLTSFRSPPGSSGLVRSSTGKRTENGGVGGIGIRIGSPPLMARSLVCVRPWPLDPRV